MELGGMASEELALCCGGRTTSLRLAFLERDCELVAAFYSVLSGPGTRIRGGDGVSRIELAKEPAESSRKRRERKKRRRRR
jgi:hypothetical protein